MKILKKGKIPKHRTARVTCTGLGNGMGGCGAVLSISESDVYETLDQRGRYDSGSKAKTIFCPQCGTETDLDAKVHLHAYGDKPQPRTLDELKNKWLQRLKKGK